MERCKALTVTEKRERKRTAIGLIKRAGDCRKSPAHAVKAELPFVP